jgi:hypothetical protein
MLASISNIKHFKNRRATKVVKGTFFVEFIQNTFTQTKVIRLLKIRNFAPLKMFWPNLPANLQFLEKEICR